MGFVVAVGADDEHRVERQMPRRELEQPQRRIVGPMQVVQYDDQPVPVGCGGQETGRVVEEAEPGRLAIPAGGFARLVGHQRAGLAEIDSGSG